MRRRCKVTPGAWPPHRRLRTRNWCRTCTGRRGFLKRLFAALVATRVSLPAKTTTTTSRKTLLSLSLFMYFTALFITSFAPSLSNIDCLIHWIAFSTSGRLVPLCSSPKWVVLAQCEDPASAFRLILFGLFCGRFRLKYLDFIVLKRLFHWFYLKQHFFV